MQPKSQANVNQVTKANEIDLLALVGNLLDRKWFIATITAMFSVVGIAIAVLSPPVYQATAMIQVEESSPSVPGLDDMASMFEGTSEAITEIELLKSRTVIGQTTDSLKLNMLVEPKRMPLIGGYFYRKFTPQSENELAEPMFGASSYAWGGEALDLFSFDIPSSLMGQKFELVAGNQQNFTLYTEDGEQVISGKVGTEVSNSLYQITIRKLNARPGTRFTLIKNYRLSTILKLQREIGASEKGKKSGIINLSYQHQNPQHAESVLNNIADFYVRQNVERNSVEAKKSLDFLRIQLPQIKADLEQAETRFNDFQKAQQSVNITLETQGVLEQIVELESTLQELELRRLQISLKFKRQHPNYQAVLSQIKSINDQKSKLSSKVKALPETQQALLGLMRDVEVGNEIYMLLLAKTQELDIVRAGTVGNVRLVDRAEVDRTEPVKPKKAFLAIITTLLGAFIAIVIVLIQKALNKGVEDPTEIEAIGLPVYASVPFSTNQDNLTALTKGLTKGLNKSRKRKIRENKSVLAVENPADLSIEALRSLRTSLHFAMMEAKNNVIAISGPSPGVGKSFISANLGAILAQSGQKVLVIDADMRKGYLQKHFGISWENGLSDYLSGQQTLEQVTKSTNVEGLHLITRGQVPPNPSELLMHENFSKLITEIKAKYDIVIIDTPPILAVTDPAIVGGHAGTMLLITRFGQNGIKEIEYARQRFEQNGIDVKGVVFNGVVKKASNAYGYYGHYNYEYKSDEK
jgi:tyrosine-protein kinase Etk/Wzc